MSYLDIILSCVGWSVKIGRFFYQGLHKALGLKEGIELPPDIIQEKILTGSSPDSPTNIIRMGKYKNRRCDLRGTCPFCVEFSRRSTKTYCIRFDFRPVCWFKRIIQANTLVAQYGIARLFGLHYIKKYEQ